MYALQQKEKRPLILGAAFLKMKRQKLFRRFGNSLLFY